jgi:capsule polysaccharide modification protein KpsS
VIEPNSKYDTYQLIKDALCVVTYGSTAGIEATLLKKPSILVGPALHERLNATINVNGESDLRELLDKIIHNKININDNLYQAYKYAFWHSQAGTRFRYNKIVGNIESQDPLLEVCGIKLTYHFLYKLMYKLQNKFYPSRLFH